MKTLHRQVLCAIRAHDLLGSDDRVAVAISGGADSVGLLRVLVDLQDGGDLPGVLAGLIHVNHQLRGDESDRDERFCRALAERLELPIEIAAFDVASLARASGRSIESAARDVRYGFFHEAAGRLGATRVATGHTLDDQAETVLLRLLRGSGGRGLGAIRIRRGIFIRPLLTSRRTAVRDYVLSRGESFCEDSSNARLDVPRNRVRHQLLPVIEDLSPGAVPALARVARFAAQDESYLEEQAIKAAGSVVLFKDGGVQLHVGTLNELPPPIGRRVLRRVLEELRPDKGFSARHIEALARMFAAAPRTAHLDLPGTVADRQGETVVVGPAARTGPAQAGRHVRAGHHDRGFEVELAVPGAAVLSSVGLHMTAARHDEAVADALMGGGDVAVVQAASIQGPLIVRSRQPGDRLRPLGAPGHRRLQDLLVDRKIPRGERDRVPVVVDAAGRIIWVAGVAIAEQCRVTAPGAGVVVLKLERSLPRASNASERDGGRAGAKPPA